MQLGTVLDLRFVRSILIAYTLIFKKEFAESESNIKKLGMLIKLRTQDSDNKS